MYRKNMICITNRKLCEEDFEKRIQKIAAASPAAVILREKDLSKEEYRRLAAELMPICREKNVPLIFHSFTGVAMELSADGLHQPMHLLREMTDKERRSFRILGASCHSVLEAKEAESLGCSYITASHILETDCKKGLEPKGFSFLREMCEAVSIPVWALGGMKPKHLSEAKKAGAAGICMMGAFMKCEDVEIFLNKK